MTQHEVIDPFEERAVPMEHQKEHGCAEVGLRVPLSLGTVREDFDKKGEPGHYQEVLHRRLFQELLRRTGVQLHPPEALTRSEYALLSAQNEIQGRYSPTPAREGEKAAEDHTLSHRDV